MVQSYNISPERPLILFDGHCNLCNGAVRFVIARDGRKRFRFAALTWPVGEQLREEYPELNGVDSIVYYNGAQVYVRSAAALKIASGMGFLWKLTGIFWVIPAPLRDVVYNWVARNRYKWFGKEDTCMMPTPELQERFLRK